MRHRWAVLPALSLLALVAMYSVCREQTVASTIFEMCKRFSYGALYAGGFWTVSIALRNWMNRLANAGLPAVVTTSLLGPGYFKVSGVDHDTRFAITEFVYADSPRNAQFKVELKGVDVAEVERA